MLLNSESLKKALPLKILKAVNILNQMTELITKLKMMKSTWKCFRKNSSTSNSERDNLKLLK
jgi:hypothetical protein